MCDKLVSLQLIYDCSAVLQFLHTFLFENFFSKSTLAKKALQTNTIKLTGPA